MKSRKLTLLIATIVLGAGMLNAQSADPFATGGGADAVGGATSGRSAPGGAVTGWPAQPGTNRLTGVVKVDASGRATLAVGKSTYELSFTGGGGAQVRSGTTVTVEGRVVSNSSMPLPVVQVNRLTVGGQTAQRYDREDEDEHGSRDDRGGRGGRHDDDD